MPEKPVRWTPKLERMQAAAQSALDLCRQAAGEPDGNAPLHDWDLMVGARIGFLAAAEKIPWALAVWELKHMTRDQVAEGLDRAKKLSAAEFGLLRHAVKEELRIRRWLLNFSEMRREEGLARQFGDRIGTITSGDPRAGRTAP